MRDPWRYRCPKGHAGFSISHTRNVIRCRSCSKEYRFKIDVKTDTKVPL